MLMLPKFICRFNAISIKIPMRITTVFDILVLKVMQEEKGLGTDRVFPKENELDMKTSPIRYENLS